MNDLNPPGVEVQMAIGFHPLANIFPLLEGPAFEEFKANIAAHGLRDPIYLYEGQILDGRNRYRACVDLGIEPETREFRGADPLAFVISLNLHRRHLTESQRAMVAANIANLPKGQRQDRSIDPSTTQEQAASLLNVSVPSVKRAAKVRNEGAPGLVAAVESGEIKVSKAADLVKLTPDEQERVVARGPAEIIKAANAIRQLSTEGCKKERERKIAATCAKNEPLDGSLGKFALLLADPPWRYEIAASDRRKIENHYPTMSIEDLCTLRVSEVTHSDAILFLWVPVPQNPEGLRVMSAWGFEYKTGAVWVKRGAPGMGHYFRTDHEYLLIGTRGSVPTPQTVDRVSSIINASKRAHSQKPDEAYEIIERMYPELPKLELFARQARPGWAAWGNEAF